MCPRRNDEEKRREAENLFRCDLSETVSENAHFVRNAENLSVACNLNSSGDSEEKRERNLKASVQSFREEASHIERREEEKSHGLLLLVQCLPI